MISWVALYRNLKVKNKNKKISLKRKNHDSSDFEKVVEGYWPLQNLTASANKRLVVIYRRVKHVIQPVFGFPFIFFFGILNNLIFENHVAH